jgi:acetylornithine/N-succinyldiaminopimelate aminotransferase
MLCKNRLADALPPGSHGSTFGGNALAARAALTVLETLESERLLEQVQPKGEHLRAGLSALAKKHARSCEGTRGLGLLQALVLDPAVDARQVLARIREAGVLLTIAGGRALRFSPPLTVTNDELTEGLDIVDSALGDL